jgi:hypothetical protein
MNRRKGPTDQSRTATSKKRHHVVPRRLVRIGAWGLAKAPATGGSTRDGRA